MKKNLIVSIFSNLLQFLCFLLLLCNVFITVTHISNGIHTFFLLICNVSFNISGKNPLEWIWSKYSDQVCSFPFITFYNFILTWRIFKTFIEKYVNLFLSISSFPYILRKSFLIYGSDKHLLTFF